MATNYQECVRCVMDTTDPQITFDSSGVCNHCVQFDNVTKREWFPGPEGAEKLNATLEQIKAAGAGQPYDCVLGLSGGVDSCYLALRALDWGLRPLVVHVDAGWNSELAVANIERVVKHCNYDLHTVVIDWEEMRELQLSYLRASIANQDVPQDHAFFACLYRFAIKNGVRYVLSGGNIATESIFPSAWHGSAMDATNLRAIHRRFGSARLKQYKTVGFFDYFLWYPFVRRMRVVRALNYLDYNKAAAVAELESTLGWRSYERKHGESLFTRFFQNHYLVEKFGYDKRRPHLSSLIVSGQMSRSEALAKLKEPLYQPEELEADISFVCKKLQITQDQFRELMVAPTHHYSEFRNHDALYRSLTRLRGTVEKSLKRRIKVYS